ncbi:hypothetical protein D9M68_715680 [compost metagenome]
MAGPVSVFIQYIRLNDNTVYFYIIYRSPVRHVKKSAVNRSECLLLLRKNGGCFFNFYLIPKSKHRRITLTLNFDIGNILIGGEQVLLVKMMGIQMSFRSDFLFVPSGIDQTQ